MTHNPDEPTLFSWLDEPTPPPADANGGGPGVGTTSQPVGPGQAAGTGASTGLPVVVPPSPAVDEETEIAVRAEHLLAQVAACAGRGIVFTPFEDARLQIAWLPGTEGEPGCSLCLKRPARGPHFLRCSLCVSAAELAMDASSRSRA